MPANPATPDLPLSPAVRSRMMTAVWDCLPRHPQASEQEIAHQRSAAQELVEALNPRDPVEAVLAVRFVIANDAGVDLLRRSMQPDLPLDAVIRLRGKGFSFWGLANATLRELHRRQESAPQLPVRRPAPAPQPAPAPRVSAPSLPPAAQPAPKPVPAPAAADTNKNPMQREPIAPPPAARPRLAALAGSSALVSGGLRPPLPGLAPTVRAA